jgi:hypothetical protein
MKQYRIDITEEQYWELDRLAEMKRQTRDEYITDLILLHLISKRKELIQSGDSRVRFFKAAILKKRFK